MIIPVKSRKINKQQIAKVAQQSATHFLLCFEQDHLDIITIISMLLDCCAKHNEAAIHLGFLHYCKLFNHVLPQQYMEVVADNDTYDFYCRELILNLINMILM